MSKKLVLNEQTTHTLAYARCCVANQLVIDRCRGIIDIPTLRSAYEDKVEMPEDLPERTELAILLNIATLYEFTTASPEQMPESFDTLVDATCWDFKNLKSYVS